MEVHLVVLSGKQQGHDIPLPETIFLIGRDDQCHLRPHCQAVSKLHCAIAAWAGKVRLRDLNSRNGTFLNGQPVHGEVGVKDGDRLQVGTLAFAFRIRNEDGVPRTAPIKDEREVKWLLDAPADSDVLARAPPTCVIPTDVAEATPSNLEETKTLLPVAAATATTPGSKAVSAGRHFHSYFEERRHGPRRVAGQELPDRKL